MLQDIAQRTKQKILSKIPLRDIRLLEIGSGSGRVTKMVAEEARLTVGVEPDEDQVRQGAADLPDVCFVRASGLNLPFGLSSFDAVLFSLSLHHHPDPDTALDEAAQAVTPDGRLLILEPMAQGEIQRLCTIFENENLRLVRAQECLARRGKRRLYQEEFTTEWVFDDFEDVCRYVFGYYDHPFDTVKQKAMREFLGLKAQQRPLVMTDTLQLTVLREGNSR